MRKYFLFIIFLFLLCINRIFLCSCPTNGGIWNELDTLVPGGASHLLRRAKQLALGSRCDSTARKYGAGWKKFCHWTKNKFGATTFPAPPWQVALYMAEVSITASSKSSINAPYYAIRWAHRLGGMSDPTDDPLPKSVLEGALRSQKGNSSPRRVVSLSLVTDLCSKLSQSGIREVRLACMVSFAFAGFFRISELLKLKVRDVAVFPSHLAVKITSSKTDVLGRGAEVILAKGETVACPIVNFTSLIEMHSAAPLPESFLFKNIRCNTFIPESQMSYSRAREELRYFLAKAGYAEDVCTWHSFRHGGASAALEAGVSERLIGNHGRWRSEAGKNTYLHDNLKAQLSVSARLGI